MPIEGRKYMLKKRLLIVLALLVAVLTVNLLMIQAADSDDLTFTENATKDGYIVSKCTSSASGTLAIPATHNGKPVVEIGSEAFLNCTELTSVTIPGSVTRIGWYAFSGCTGLTNITVPDSVTTIDWFAFSGCTNLTAVTVGNGVTCIDAAAFSGCSNLTTVTLGNSIASIGWSAFKNCTKLGSITLPKSVTSIDRYAFSGCANLGSIVIPGAVNSIGDGAFYSCGKLSSVTFCGTQEQWDAVHKGNYNESLANATPEFHKYENGVCSICQQPDGNVEYAAGDIDGDGDVTYNDAVYLLLYTMFDEANYPLDYAQGDIDGNGSVDQDDAVYLLLHTLFGDAYYPLYASAGRPTAGVNGSPIA